MNKKYILGSLMIGLFTIMLVTAGLVNYLSNSVEKDVEVTSPIAIYEFTGDTTAYGGETKVITTGLENLANAQIKGKLKVVISNEGISLEDFDSLTTNIIEQVPGIADWNSGNLDMTKEEGFIESIVDNGDKLVFTTTERTFEIGETWDATIALGFKSNAEGNYNIEVQLIPLD